MTKPLGTKKEFSKEEILPEKGEKEDETKESMEQTLMYVGTGINQNPTKSTMVDLGFTNNLLIEVEA